MFTPSNLLQLCALFSKKAQNTAIDTKLQKGYDPRDKWEREHAKKLIQDELDKQESLFTTKEKRPNPWQPGPYKYPEWAAIEQQTRQKNWDEEASKRKEDKSSQPKIEEEEELPSQETKFLVPEIGLEHFPETPGIDPVTQLPPDVKAKYLEGKLPPHIMKMLDKRVQEYHEQTKLKAARQQFIDKYNEFRYKLKILLDAYREANVLAETQPNIDGLENSSLVEVVRGLSEYAVKLIRWNAGADFGVAFSRRGTLSKYLHQQFNPFSINERNVQTYLIDFNVALSEIDEILEQYARMKTLEKHVVRHLVPEINDFLSDQENIDLLNWTDENNPDAKKTIYQRFR